MTLPAESEFCVGHKWKSSVAEPESAGERTERDFALPGLGPKGAASYSTEEAEIRARRRVWPFSLVADDVLRRGCVDPRLLF